MIKPPYGAKKGRPVSRTAPQGTWMRQMFPPLISLAM